MRWLPLILGILLQGSSSAEEPANWPQWRGPLGTGVAPDADPPVEWTATNNVRWKTPIPGRGHSSPIVIDDRVFLTTAIPVGPKLPPKTSGRPGAHDNVPVDSEHRYQVIAVDRRSGKLLWETEVHRSIPVEGGHRTASLASPSPVSDGEHVWAFFGSQGLYCLDLDGQLKWKRVLGQMHTKHGHGEGSSPVLWGNTLFVNWDHEEESFCVAMDKTTGRELWRHKRNEVTSWSTPLVIQVGDQVQVIVCGTERVRGYDLRSGDVIWECGGLSANIVATPVSADGILYVGSSYDKRALVAIRLQGALGDITDGDKVLWTRSRGTPYVPSPLLYDDGLYFLTHYQNILTRVNGPTGEDAPGAMRLGMLGNLYASPVAAAGRIYLTDLDGVTAVLSSGPIPKLLAINRLEENVNASAAISGDAIYLRGERHLYCFAESIDD